MARGVAVRAAAAAAIRTECAKGAGGATSPPCRGTTLKISWATPLTRSRRVWTEPGAKAAALRRHGHALAVSDPGGASACLHRGDGPVKPRRGDGRAHLGPRLAPGRAVRYEGKLVSSLCMDTPHIRSMHDTSCACFFDCLCACACLCVDVRGCAWLCVVVRGCVCLCVRSSTKAFPVGSAILAARPAVLPQESCFV